MLDECLCHCLFDCPSACKKLNLLGRWFSSSGGRSETLKLYDFGWMVRTKKKSFSKLYIRIFNSRHSDNITTASKNERFGGGDDFHCRLLCLSISPGFSISLIVYNFYHDSTVYMVGGCKYIGGRLFFWRMLEKELVLF